MGRVNACFTCGLQHASDTGCKHTCTNSVPNACPKGCLHNKVPVNPAVCKHSNESPSITVSKVGSDKAIPMMDILTIKSIPLDVQYDTGCQLSLITTSALILLPQTSYSLGNSNMINLLAYNGISELLPATEVKLNLGNRVIKLIAVYSNLNCGSAYSFPTPHKWRKYTKCNVTSHSGKVAILLGGDNYHCHSSHVKEDERGVILLRSKLSGRHIIFAPVNPSSITWSQSKNNINLVNASLPTPLWTQSTTRYLSSIYTTRRSCPNQVKTKKALLLHNKIFPKPDVASEKDQYIYEQVENGNYVEINRSGACLNHQLHFVGYNFVVSSTSSSTKVRMTTDSSMRTESGLSLNMVTKPAPGVVPSLLLRPRCHVYYSVFDINKFFCSVCIDDRDS